MPRKPRLQFSGAIYHIMSQGDGRRPIFVDSADRRDFIKILAEACGKTGWQVHAYCLMPDHYHLVLETPAPNLSAGMAWMQSAFTIRFNHRHNRTGRVLCGRYKSQLVEGGGAGHLRTACDYVHLNPVRARLLKSRQPLRSYPWSSLRAYLAGPRHRPAWIRVDRLLGEHGIEADTGVGRTRFERGMERQRQEETGPGELKALRRGWCLGSRAFKRKLLQRMDSRLEDYHSGGPRRGMGKARVDQIVAEELKRLGWRAADLKRRRRSDPDKLEIGARLRRETTLTIKAIAARVSLGTPKAANANLYRHIRKGL